MATIPRSLVDSLTEEVNALSSAGRQMVENVLERLVPMFADADGRIPGENVAALRAAVCEAMEAVCGQVSDLAAARAAEFYDEVRTASVGKQLGALVDAGRDSAATEGAVRALVQSVVDTGAVDRFARELGDRVDYEVKRAAAECVERNARRDPLKPKWARVPSGAETCPFCIMLASRGFVYHSERSAEGRYHGHPGCDCRIVPGFEGADVEGYDLNVLYDRYVADVRDGNLKLNDVKKTSSKKAVWRSEQFADYGDFVRFIDEAEDIDDLQARCAIAQSEWKKTRLSDRYWSQLRASVVRKRAEIADQKPPGLITFDERAEPMKKELDVGNWFAARGYDVHFRATRSAEGKRTSDMFLNGDSYELKQPRGNGKQTIFHQFEEAAGQSTRIALDISEVEKPESGDRWTRKNVIEAANKYLQWHFKDDDGHMMQFDEVILISSDYIKHIKRGS